MSTPTTSTGPTTRSVTGLQLAVVAEPVAAKHALRAVAEESPAQAAELLTRPDGLAAHLWQRWGPPLEDAGISKHDFLSVLAAYERELWHWIWDDRPWSHCSQGLAGRLNRRTPDHSHPSRGGPHG
jgi:hypothetical protein